ncbi:condensation domain-containing protein [Chitinophaga sancti]|uniref:Condensation domain-containing protein n=1 Tax=Chitinophaga sancti TaxID=1004 RepID=A0A1K1Q5K8_9BACT|nr:condensation domain-containing protein [Chitinophaga sancti]WQD61134.1 condensation domain-containing protein [Chitinophaga sancti]WQG86739.1 condensation domain-containing protein [Chitinophaga sancti]SFW55005.1 Condensation domain-containing protein [Chitinophaga sancti]
MKRRLLFPERLMLGDGNTPFNVVSTIRIKGSISAEQLSHALACIQAKHPLLRANIIDDHYVVQDHPAAIPLKIVHSTDWETVTVSELAQPFDTTTAPLARLTWIRALGYNDLVLTLHHCLCDGGGRWALIREIVALLDNPGLDIGEHRSLLTLEDIIPLSQQKGWPLFKAKFTGGMIKYGCQLLAALVSAKGRSKTLREKDYLLHWKLDASTTSSLIRQCNAMGVTVNTALCVALAAAFRNVKGDQGAARVTCPVDIRKYVPAITRDSIFAVGLSITLDIVDDHNKPFWTRVQLLQPTATDKQRRLNTAMLHALEYAHTAIPHMIKFLTYGKLNYNLMFSNMGKLDLEEHWHSFDIDTVFSPAVIGPFANPNTILSSTFKGQMDFTFISNDDFLAKEDAVAIKNAFLQILKEVLPSTTPILTV